MGDEDEVAADCAMDSVDCGERERESGPSIVGYGAPHRKETHF